MEALPFAQIKPFVRYARFLTLSDSDRFLGMIPYDSRLFFTVSGKGTVRIGKTVYDMLPGTLLLIPTETEYDLCESTDTVTYLALNFDYTFAHTELQLPVPPVVRSQFSPERIIEKTVFADVSELSVPVHLSGMSDLLGKLTEIEREYTGKILFYELRISAILSEILVECIRRLRMQTLSGGKEATDRVLGYIHDHFKQPLTNTQLGERFGFHPNYISSLIKRYTGMPLHHYLLCVKISHAVDMLNGHDLSIAEIAEECGFCNIYYFSKYFKQYMGVSPSQYRKRNGGM